MIIDNITNLNCAGGREEADFKMYGERRGKGFHVLTDQEKEMECKDVFVDELNNPCRLMQNKAMEEHGGERSLSLSEKEDDEENNEDDVNDDGNDDEDGDDSENDKDGDDGGKDDYDEDGDDDENGDYVENNNDNEDSDDDENGDDDGDDDEDNDEDEDKDDSDDDKDKNKEDQGSAEEDVQEFTAGTSKEKEFSADKTKNDENDKEQEQNKQHTEKDGGSIQGENSMQGTSSSSEEESEEDELEELEVAATGNKCVEDKGEDNSRNEGQEDDHLLVTDATVTAGHKRKSDCSEEDLTGGAQQVRRSSKRKKITSEASKDNDNYSSDDEDYDVDDKDDDYVDENNGDDDDDDDDYVYADDYDEVGNKNVEDDDENYEDEELDATPPTKKQRTRRSPRVAVIEAKKKEVASSRHGTVVEEKEDEDDGNITRKKLGIVPLLTELGELHTVIGTLTSNAQNHSTRKNRAVTRQIDYLGRVCVIDFGLDNEAEMLKTLIAYRALLAEINELKARARMNTNNIDDEASRQKLHETSLNRFMVFIENDVNRKDNNGISGLVSVLSDHPDIRNFILKEHKQDRHWHPSSCFIVSCKKIMLKISF